jgi:putative hydrolase of the HAD superfamily
MSRAIMKKTALIFDLDDTIYATKSVVSEMYEELFSLLNKHLNEEIIFQIQEDILTTPFHIVAQRNNLDKNLGDEALKICLDMDFKGRMEPFPDYSLTKENSALRFLVTAGYTKLQKSKIRQLGIQKEFKEIFIPDPYTSELTKSDVFKQILNSYQLNPSEVLIIGDNPETEIIAARGLGIDSYLYDYEAKFSPSLSEYYGTSYHNFSEIDII